METGLEALMTRVMRESYVRGAGEAISRRETLIRQLVEKRKCPEEGWDEMTIEMFLQKISLMDSNNFAGNSGVGEREARFGCDIVARRHFRLGHGIGRSGDLTEVQPKAVGSSLMNLVCNSVVLDMLRTCGAPNTKACFVVPMATGMSLVLCLLSLREKRKNAKYVMWPRIDQKSCFKCISTSGFEPIVVENKREGDALVTDLGAIESNVLKYGAESIACILSTTSCFAPRLPDDLEGISKLCREQGIPHLVNNAYGVQSSKCMHVIEQASRSGRIDAYVQSSDKNFLVPVGGSIIAGFDPEFVARVSSTYPGRGSGSPSLDLLITLLHLGVNGYKALLKERKENMIYLKQNMEAVASQFGEKVLETGANTISVGMTLNRLKAKEEETEVGSMLFLRSVSGARVVVSRGDVKEISGHSFTNWTSHCDCYPHSYLTAAAAIGVTRKEIDIFIKKLTLVLTTLGKRSNKET